MHMSTRRNRGSFSAIAFLALAALAAWPGVSASETVELPLVKLTPYGVITLQCVNGAQEISIPVPDRWIVKRAVLKLVYAASPVILKDQSKLMAKLNDFPVGYVPLDPSMHRMEAHLELPADLMQPGYNSLLIEVFQHYSHKECEFPCAPDLWTTIMVDKSSLTIEYDLKPLQPMLSTAAREMFDPKILPHGRVNVITEGASDDIISAAVTAASGVAKRFDYQKVLFSASQDILPGVDNILIGRAEFVSAFLQSRGVNAEIPTAGGHLRIERLPVEKINEKGEKWYEPSPSLGLVVITGKTYGDVKIASETLANMTIAFPGAPFMTTLQFDMPEIALYSGRLVLTADKKYTFKTLNTPTHTFLGFNATPRTIMFRLPADFLIKSNQKAEINLNFMYGPGFSPTSSFNVLLNDKVIRSIHLDAKSGAFIEDYKIEIPAYMFRVGANTISFAPHMAPEAKMCDFIQTGNLVVTLFDSSTLYFPPMPHFVELPKMELFLLNGFPFTRWPDGYDAKLYLADSDNMTLEAALNVIGMATQKNGFPLFMMEVTTKPPVDYNGELLVVGEASKISQKLLDNAPVVLGKSFKVPYPVVRSWEGEAMLVFSQSISQFGPGRGLFMEFQSPFKEGRTVFLMTASSREDLVRTSKALMDGNVQSRMEGDVALVELTEPDYKVVSFSAGKKYTTGKSGKIPLWQSYIQSDPKRYYAIVAVLIIALGSAIYFAMKGVLRRRTKTAAK